MKRTTCSALVLAFAMAPAAAAGAQLGLPRAFGDDMVVQRDKAASIWGWGDEGDAITVEFNGQTKTTTVGADGRWLVALPPMPANATPQELKVRGRKDSLAFKNVVIGDVWLCSGQSNMESDAGGIVDSDLDMPRARYPGIRCLTIPLRSSPVPLEDFPVEERNPFYAELKGVWRVCTPDTARDFPAVGYHFARIVHEMTGVPIGLIDTSWGGSVVESWISRKTLADIPEAGPLLEAFDAEVAAYDPRAELDRKMEAWKRQVAKAEADGRQPPAKPEMPEGYGYRQGFPGGCFNGLIAPIQRLAIKGVLFYQGENNCVGGQGRPNLYLKTFPALIPDWRQAFHDDDLPFCIVQLSSFGHPDDIDDPEDAMLHKASGIREAQTKARLLHANTGLVCTYDLGHVQMHSPFKRPIGERAARWALADVYKVGGIDYNIPFLESWRKDGNRILLSFTKDSHPSSPYGARVPPRGFVIAGADRHFHPAQVEGVERGEFAVSSPLVADPVAVRYAWGVHPQANFGNRAGPAPPFRTDDWPCWLDSGYGRREPAEHPRAAEVPDAVTATRQSWERRAAQARDLLERYDTWKRSSSEQRRPADTRGTRHEAP